MTPAPWLVPDWPAPAGVRAVFTLRGAGAQAGASGGPWRHFNLGDHVGDDPQAVAANRARLQRQAQMRPVFLRQVHGCDVLQLRPDTPHGAVADGVVATDRGLACTVLVADCLPILLTDLRGRRVAAMHAGWRGLAGGVIEQTFKRFMALRPANQALEAIDIEANEVLAWLGPCIGPEAFEVGAEVRAAFMQADAQAQRCFRALGDGKYLADLPALARQRLARLGVTRIHGNDGGPAWCTVRDEGRFFSHRRDQQRLGGSGRMAACIWRI